MPTVLRDGPYRFYFVSSDRDEPSHIHVRTHSGFAKFWLDPERCREVVVSDGWNCAAFRELLNEITVHSWRLGMTTSTVELDVPGATSITVTNTLLTAELADGRIISVPLVWYPRLVHATEDERNNWELHAGSQHIHWADLDEDISVEGLLAGRRSGESQASLKRWLRARLAGRGFTLHELRGED